MQRVSIARLKSGCYVWALTYGHETIHENEDLSPSIEACLAEAAEVVLDEPLIEISYRGVTTGTIPVARLLGDSAAVADWIVAEYAALAQWIPGFDEH